MCHLILTVGVPQGSILLFILYINDLPDAAVQSSVLIYADDTVILYSEAGFCHQR